MEQLPFGRLMVMSLVDFPSLDTVPVLTRRLDAVGVEACMQLPLTAEERTRLRGLRCTACGQSVLLQLPRQGPLQPGESLAAAEGSVLVRVVAASEKLLLVRAPSELALLEAAYHLGNRHVALELRTKQLRLLDDPVLADLLRVRGLALESVMEPFYPEPGAYQGVHSHDQQPIDGHQQRHH